jgi:protein-tyrosine phosphatase
VTSTAIDSLSNLRDLGGLRTRDGRVVRSRRLYRSATPLFLTASDSRLLIEQVGIRARIDLRSSLELTHGTSVYLTALEPFAAHLPFRSGGVWIEDATIPDASERVASHYLRYLACSPESVVGVVRLLADSDRLPALVHCTAGKDRTGVAVAITLSAIGVLDDEIVDDYAQTREHLDMVMAQLRNVPSYASRIAELPAESLTAEPESMALFLRQMDEAHGGARAYLLRHGVRESTLDALAQTLLSPAPMPSSATTASESRVSCTW